MGCDIHSFVEVKRDDKWERVFDKIFQDYGDSMTSEPFGNRSYSVFGFLADVRNYSHCPPISEQKGLPEDSEWLNSPHKYAYETNPMSGEVIPYAERETNKKYLQDDWNYHSFSYLTLKELVDFDYSKTFENRRYTKVEVNSSGGRFSDGSAVAKEGEGEIITFRNHLGTGFFQDLAQLRMLGSPEDVRIVFYFDN